MKIKDLLNEKYPFKLRTVQCIDILKEQNQKRLAETKKNCKECQYGACTNSLNEICIEHEGGFEMKFTDEIVEVLESREYTKNETMFEEWDIIAHTDDDEPTYYTATISRHCGTGKGCFWTDFEIDKVQMPQFGHQSCYKYQPAKVWRE